MDTVGTPALWIGFIGFVLVMLGLDLGVFHRKSHEVRFREAAIWTAVWVTLSLIFAGGVAFRFGSEVGMQFLTGYLVEKTLSVDNIFVFVVVFGSLGVPAAMQHRVLFWGILSALVLRAGMIFGGVALLKQFHWLIYVFGAFLIVTGIRLFVAWKTHKEQHPEESAVLRLIRRAVRATPSFDGQRFFTVENGRRLATPLFLALVLIEVSDVIFALDSIPAIFAITSDPFIVFTSNIFAILGLRAMYFLLAGLVNRFAYLKVGLSAVLIFVGVKMTVAEWVAIPPAVSLVVITTMIGTSVVASLVAARRLERAAQAEEHA